MGPPFSSAIAVPWGNRSHGDQNSVIWLVSAIPAKAPSAFSCSIWVLDSLLQHMANSSMEMNSFPFRFSPVSMAAASPKPCTVTKGGSSPFSALLQPVTEPEIDCQ